MFIIICPPRFETNANIIDEAHNIKNYQSQRWQTLIHFNTQRRLLLTGTPLQVCNFGILTYKQNAKRK